jgi:hypothetical protein
MRAGVSGVARVAPDVVINADNVRCDDTITALLKSRGLSYFYNHDAQMIRIGRREELFASAAPDEFKGLLPPGHRVSLNAKDEDVRTVLEQIAREERIKIIVPNKIIGGGRVTARFKDVPWDQAFEAVLESQGLWYRHSKDSDTVTVFANLNVGPPPKERFEQYRSGSDQ